MQIRDKMCKTAKQELHTYFSSNKPEHKKTRRRSKKPLADDRMRMLTGSLDASIKVR